MNLMLFPQGRDPGVAAAVRNLAASADDERGAVYTRREIVGLLLDLAGYRADAPLHELRALEPSFGGGDFLLPMVERLLAAWSRTGRRSDLSHAMLAVELHPQSHAETRARLELLLHSHGVDEATSTRWLAAWLRCDDFLLTELDGPFDVVVGNPPYLRPERIPKVLLDEYRRRFTTMYDRADLYIAFIERALQHLNEGGVLGFVCANRWHKNKYGGPLRQMVHRDFHLAFHLDLTGVDAFDREVLAYPAITVIRRQPAAPTVIGSIAEVSAPALEALATSMLSADVSSPDVVVAGGVTSGRDPWLLHDPRKLVLLRRLERDFPVIEDDGARIGIGVATGRDAVFIQPMSRLDVEPERVVPLIKAPDIRDGTLAWSGLGLLNPYDEAGRLVRLDDWPRFAALLREHEEALRARNVAKRHPRTWFRTIDKVHPDLRATPKLLIPDIKGEPHVVFDPGEFYPHHNLYWVTSDRWDLRALQAVLRSEVSRLVVEAYCVGMAGGYLRFQAQYLRRIPVPRWDSLGDSLRERLAEAGASSDLVALNQVVADAYGLSVAERRVLFERASQESTS